MTTQPVLQALGIISYDDHTETYHLRAFNDGRFLESDVKLLADGNGLTWGFSFGEIRRSSVLKINSRVNGSNSPKSPSAPTPKKAYGPDCPTRIVVGLGKY